MNPYSTAVYIHQFFVSRAPHIETIPFFESFPALKGGLILYFYPINAGASEIFLAFSMTM